MAIFFYVRGQQFAHAFARQFADFPLQVTYARFAGVVLDDVGNDSVFQCKFVFAQAMFTDCRGRI